MEYLKCLRCNEILDLVKCNNETDIGACRNKVYHYECCECETKHYIMSNNNWNTSSIEEKQKQLQLFIIDEEDEKWMNTPLTEKEIKSVSDKDKLIDWMEEN